MAQSEDLTLSAKLDVVDLAIDSKAYWLDLADRASKTFVQNLLIFLGAGATIVSVPWPQALSAAGLATLASVLLALSTASLLSSGHFLIDLGDRAARTFAGTLLAAIPLADGAGFGGVDWRHAFTLAGTAVLVSVLTSLGTANLGSAKGLPSLAPVSPVIDLEDDEFDVDDDELDVVDRPVRTATVGESGEPIPYRDGRHHTKE
ncbi:holin [Rhodococcoides fascians]|uniref:holin n=1 Tax=Rhodococcoides fascians TaxID=1828 RepID=UPI0009B8DA06|nr:holin [Rhodococcus fascians]